MDECTQTLRKALIKRAEGYEYDEKEVILDKNGKNTGKIKITKKHVPPDLAAIKQIIDLKKADEW